MSYVVSTIVFHEEYHGGRLVKMPEYIRFSYEEPVQYCCECDVELDDQQDCPECGTNYCP